MIEASTNAAAASSGTDSLAKKREAKEVGISEAAKVIANSGSYEEALEAAFKAALATGACHETAAEVAGIVIGNTVIARGGSKEEASRAAAKATRAHRGSPTAQAASAAAVVSDCGGTAIEAVAASSAAQTEGNLC